MMSKRRFRAVLRALTLFAVLVPLASEQSQAAGWQNIHLQGFEDDVPNRELDYL